MLLGDIMWARVNGSSCNLATCQCAIYSRLADRFDNSDFSLANNIEWGVKTVQKLTQITIVPQHSNWIILL